MDLAAPAALGVAVSCLVLGLVLGWLVAARRVRGDVAEARAEVAELRARLDRLDRLDARLIEPTPATTDYVITALGTEGDADGAEPVPVGDRTVLSVTFGEPLVKVVSFGYGVRRALSAESRNRIAFEMRRELKRARRERRRGTRRARREAAA